MPSGVKGNKEIPQAGRKPAEIAIYWTISFALYEVEKRG
jgi:hypothetical protein